MRILISLMIEGREGLRFEKKLPICDADGLMESERNMLATMPPEARATLRRLHVESLCRVGTPILGFRSDDIFSLCTFVQQGAFDVRRRETGVAVMAKNSDGLYLTANPASVALRELRPELREVMKSKTPTAALLENRNLYGYMGRLQAVGRYIVPLISHLDSFIKDVSTLLDEGFHDINTIDGKGALMEETMIVIAGCNSAYLTVLARHTEYSVQQLRESIEQFKQREGIMLAVSERALADFGLVAESEGDEGEIVIALPEGKLSLDYIVGFETMGVFEDRVMESLEEESSE